MRNLSRILTVILCCAPVMSIAAGPVATTNGSNLTSFNPNNAYNNQWATISNGRYDSNDNIARADFGNCNAVVLRCAQPKCSGGGCTDASVAEQIVAGCVKSNDKCKQYGEDLIKYMTAQLVATSNARVNEQKMALEQAKIQADAQAAAAANSQNEQMMAQMQNQMAQMQQQMAQQQEESNRQLQEALAQQQAQSAAALESMKTTATESAKENESGITSYQQEAIERGVSTDVIERKKITGQIMTEIEDSELKLKNVYAAMKNSFDYAKCDNRGNGCSAPTRIKKWRELARGFSEPYTDTLEKVYDAILTAMNVGVDVSQIYAMLSNACNNWAEYLCPGVDTDYEINYSYIDEHNEIINDAPRVCPKKWEMVSTGTRSGIPPKTIWTTVCRPCTWLKNVESDDPDILLSYVNAEKEANTNQKIVACSANVLEGNTLFAKLSKKRKGSSVVDIEILEKWIDQVESGSAKGIEVSSTNGCKDDTTCKKAGECGACYCGVKYATADVENILTRAVAKKSVLDFKNNGETLCVKDLWDKDAGQMVELGKDEECAYINPVFAICDTHPYNDNIGADKYNNENSQIDTAKQEEMNRIIGLKITVLSQQMYKQYEYLNATLKRLRIQLEKSVLKANLEAAGGKSNNSTYGGGFDADKSIHIAGAENCSNTMDYESAFNCIQKNASLVVSSVSSDRMKACKQLQSTLKAKRWLKVKDEFTDTSCNNVEKGTCDKNTVTDCAQALLQGVARARADFRREENSYRNPYYR